MDLRREELPCRLTVEQYEAAVQTEFGGADAPAILTMYPHAEFASPKLALSQIAGDVEAVCEARRIARLVERTRTPVYLYSFEREVANWPVREGMRPREAQCNFWEPFFLRSIAAGPVPAWHP